MSIQRRAPPGKKKLVWRITRDAPNGKWVDPTTIARPRVDVPERHSNTWAMSSFELTYGLDATELSDTVPAELMDELFKKPTDRE